MQNTQIIQNESQTATKGGLTMRIFTTSREHIDKECKGWDITGLKKVTLTELQEKFKLK